MPTSLLPIKLSKEMRDKLIETNLQQSIPAQQTMVEHQLIWQMPAYREAYEQTKLLPMWRILKQVCMAGFTIESLQRYAAQFAKLKQKPM